MGYKDMFVKLKITTFLMSFALLFNIAYSETNLDSLLNLLKKEKSITGKTSFILQIAKEYLYTDPEKSKLYLNRAKKLIKSSRDKNQKALYTLILGNYYYVTAKYDSAIETLTRCYRLAERIGIQDIYIRSLNIIAVIHARAGEYSRSNKILKELLQLSENKNDSTNLLRLCSNLATNYLLTEKPDSAAIWYEKALKYTGNNNFYKAAVEVNLANLNVQVGNYSKAREYALSAINHVKSRYDEELYLEALTNIVNSYLGEKNYDKAIDDFSRVIEPKSVSILFWNSYLNFEIPIAYLFRSYCYHKMGDNEKSSNDLSSFGGMLKKNLPCRIYDIIGRDFFKKFKKYSSILKETVTDSSIYFMLKLMEFLFSTSYKRYYESARILDNFDFEEKPLNDAQSLIFEIFQQCYPKFDGSLSGTLERDGRELFIISSKLSILEYSYSRILKNKAVRFILFFLFIFIYFFFPWLRLSIFIAWIFLALCLFPKLYSGIPSLYIAINKALQERNTELAEKKGGEKAQIVIEHKRELNELRTNIFQAVSHTISNIMLANKSITKRIRNGTNSVNDVNRLELLNDLVLSTMKAVKLAFSKENIVVSKAPDDLSWEKIKDSISLHDLLYFCLNINMNYLVSGEGEEAWATIRNVFFFVNKYDRKNYLNKLSMLKELRKSPHFSIFELSEDQTANFVDVFWSEQFQPVHQFFGVQIEELRNLYVKKNSYTFSVLFIILLELTKNMLRYGTIENREARKFVMRSETDDDYIILTLANVCQKSRLNLKESTHKGLTMIQEFSKVLGKFEKAEKDIGDSDFLEFTTTLFIRKPEHQKTV